MRTLTLACVLMTCAGASAEELTIADLAPEESFLIMGVDNSKSTIENFQKTGVFAFYNDPEMREWLGGLIEEPMAELDGFLSSIDADIDDFSKPTGMLGMAVWMNTPEDDAEGNEAMPVQMLMSAAFGENAVDMHSMIVKALENGEDEETLTYSMERLGEAEVYTITPTETEDADLDDEWGDQDDWGDDDFADLDAGPSGPSEMYYARQGEVLMLSTSIDDMENAISRIEGVGFDNAAATASFSRLKPAGDDYDAYAVLVNAPLYDIADAMGADPNMEMMGIPPIMTLLDAFGLSEVRGASMTMNFDDERGDTVGEIFVAAPRLRGLLSLINVPDEAFTPPAFVSQDAASVSLFQFDIAGLLPTITQSINKLPAEFAQQAGFFLDQARGQIQPIFSQLGPEIYIAQSFKRPYAVDSRQSMVAIRAKDTKALNEQFSNLATLAGLEGRDFQGNQIWSMPEGAGGMLPIPGGGDVSVGIGFGHMFLGPTASVETAMRQAANPGEGMGNNADFKKAMQSLDNNGLSFSYTNLEEMLNYANWTSKNIDKIVAQQVEDMMGDWADEATMAQAREQMLEAAKEMTPPNMDKMLKYLGDIVTEFQLVDGGIKGSYILLRADD